MILIFIGTVLLTLPISAKSGRFTNPVDALFTATSATCVTGLSVYDTVNLASIVEKESSGDETVRAQVAAVFYNRLTTKGEPSNGYLQSDATTAYEVGHDPSADEVHANSPYSTYTNAGLPPTPICSPSIECLQAVCSPNKDALGKYYFFYFQNDKYTFSETYDEHKAAFS